MQTKLTALGVAVLVVCLPVMSCTHKPYHPDKTDREWTIDHEACERWVREGIRTEPDTYDVFDEMRLVRQCMKDKGWQWERTNLFNFKKAEPQ